MSKNKYFLVARNRLNREFKIIKFDGSEIRTRVLPENLDTLTNIDRFTTVFKDSEELNKYLYTNCKVETPNNDIFILCRGTNNSLSTMECIYNNKYQLQSIINILENKDLSETEREVIFEVFRSFLTKMRYSDRFYYHVMDGNTNIYESFIDNFRDEGASLSDYYNKLYSNKWSFSSYPLIRNIVEAMESYDNKHESIDSLNRQRESIKDKLFEVTDDNYLDGQINLFDYFDENKAYEKKSS